MKLHALLLLAAIVACPAGSTAAAGNATTAPARRLQQAAYSPLGYFCGGSGRCCTPAAAGCPACAGAPAGARRACMHGVAHSSLPGVGWRACHSCLPLAAAC